MSRSTRIALTFFLSISFFFSFFISALRILALENFEIASHYFAFGARLPDVINYLLFLSVLIFFVCGLYLRGKISLATSERGIPFYFGNALLGASLAAYALFSFPLFFETDKLESVSSPASGSFSLLCTLFAVIGVFFCIHNCLFPNAERNRRVVFGLSLPLFAVFNVLALYFDTTIPLNAPNKLFDQFTYVFVALYLLYELRILIAAPRYAAQCALGFITMVFTAANGFPSFIYMCRHRTPLSDNASHDVLMIALFLYVSIRMVRLLFTESARNDCVLTLLTEAEHPAADLTLRADSIELEENEEENSQLTFDTVNTLDLASIPAEAFDENAQFSEDGRPIMMDAVIEDVETPTSENESDTPASDLQESENA